MSRSALGHIFLSLLLVSVLSPLAHAAGFNTIEVPADSHGGVLRGAVWYPCATPAEPFQLGPVVLSGVRRCAATGANWPLIVLSHGSGGSYLGHHDTAEALADAGFVVVAINHPGDNFQDLSDQGHLRALANRPRDIERLIDFMTQAWPERARLAPGKIGLFGFSRGGYTGLTLAGAAPDFSLMAQYCHGADYPFCQEVRAHELPPSPSGDGRIKAYVIADPLNLFQRQALQGITAPMQLWASELGGDGVALTSVEAIRQGLMVSPQYRLVRNAGHFAFLAPCNPQQRLRLPELCTDPDGFDRGAFHRQFNAEIVRFFVQHLSNGSVQQPAQSSLTP
ncbi:alpha/beta hydrolase family protein [Paludibacterium purpuratum]|nr:alpha/beta fold hydrolase [Paludibacterium purpuratum]